MDVSANQHHHYNQKHLDLLPQEWQEKFWPVWFWSYKCSRKRPDVSSKNILHCRHKHSWTCSLSPFKPFHCHKHGFKSLIILLNIPGFGRQHVRMSPDGSSQTRSSFTSWSLEPGLEQRSLARHLLTWISDHRHWCEREMRHLHEYQSCTLWAEPDQNELWGVSSVSRSWYQNHPGGFTAPQVRETDVFLKCLDELSL